MKSYKFFSFDYLTIFNSINTFIWSDISHGMLYARTIVCHPELNLTNHPCSKLLLISTQITKRKNNKCNLQIKLSPSSLERNLGVFLKIYKKKLKLEKKNKTKPTHFKISVTLTKTIQCKTIQYKTFKYLDFIYLINYLKF